ncbi:hypothetical protein CCR75_008898 [Bremia lactucae]|uniref:Major facilitator superfamily (MFS) profile domain-containing protein n=1 Tax=Bremia lactucae TaxID=4779 RepID=A0A976ILH5_BRELC|nr:hypothetical protein CCR75_008898 [Bremia lactucae]
MMVNFLYMILNAVVQASASNIWVFMVGRMIAGIASGGATAVVPGFINKISPPTPRNYLGVKIQMAITIDNLLVAITFFFANTKRVGALSRKFQLLWRYCSWYSHLGLLLKALRGYYSWEKKRL